MVVTVLEPPPAPDVVLEVVFTCFEEELPTLLAYLPTLFSDRNSAVSFTSAARLLDAAVPAMKLALCVELPADPCTTLAGETSWVRAGGDMTFLISVFTVVVVVVGFCSYPPGDPRLGLLIDWCKVEEVYGR